MREQPADTPSRGNGQRERRLVGDPQRAGLSQRLEGGGRHNSRAPTADPKLGHEDTCGAEPQGPHEEGRNQAVAPNRATRDPGERSRDRSSSDLEGGSHIPMARTPRHKQPPPPSILKPGGGCPGVHQTGTEQPPTSEPGTTSGQTRRWRRRGSGRETRPPTGTAGEAIKIADRRPKKGPKGATSAPTPGPSEAAAGPEPPVADYGGIGHRQTEHEAGKKRGQQPRKGRGQPHERLTDPVPPANGTVQQGSVDCLHSTNHPPQARAKNAQAQGEPQAAPAHRCERRGPVQPSAANSIPSRATGTAVTKSCRTGAIPNSKHCHKQTPFRQGNIAPAGDIEPPVRGRTATRRKPVSHRRRWRNKRRPRGTTADKDANKPMSRGKATYWNTRSTQKHKGRRRASTPTGQRRSQHGHHVHRHPKEGHPPRGEQAKQPQIGLDAPASHVGKSNGPIGARPSAQWRKHQPAVEAW
nr:basic salivary proline-rich protein 1-like [Nerophis lumbriciformis]